MFDAYDDAVPPVIHMRLRPELREISPEQYQEAVAGALACALLEIVGEASAAWTIRSLSTPDSCATYELVPLPEQRVSDAAASALTAALRRQPQVAAVEPVYRRGW